MPFQAACLCKATTPLRAVILQTAAKHVPIRAPIKERIPHKHVPPAQDRRPSLAPIPCRATAPLVPAAAWPRRQDILSRTARQFFLSLQPADAMSTMCRFARGSWARRQACTADNGCLSGPRSAGLEPTGLSSGRYAEIRRDLSARKRSGISDQRDPVGVRPGFGATSPGGIF
jgi:hypothetical protein